MDRIWLRQYPPGVPAEIDPVALCFAGRAVRRKLPALRRARRLRLHGQDHHLRRTGRRLARACRLAAERAACKRGARVAVMMPNVLQYPVAIAAILRAGMTVVNVNPLYKPRELEFQLSDSGAEAIVVLENFASVLQEALPHTKVKHVVVASMGDMLGGAERHDRQFRRAPRQEVGAGLRLAQRDFLQRRARRGRQAAVQPRRRSGPTTSPSCNIPAAPPASPRAPCCCTAIMIANLLQLEAWNAPMVDRPPATEQLIVLTALPLYHIFALTACFLFGVQQRRHLHPDSEPARHRRPDQGAQEYQGQLLPGREHAVQRAAQPSRLRRASIGAC